ncbi:MAG: hypothetical protein IPP10_18500 [Candidatus Competibacteraceae bacterium]|nr:hypothetical protein [Candidatus Competibacteraceae bacterium]MBK7984915.1 hypothetical protein [Candidatus Competibacteraceae bacterium]MBK8896000.1 hypothetical protein [Candidatus Competibacteraceae bacterium]MBK8962677.1 hypothetical protein [Candidatus Competibacteraceae bacterium]MBK9953397.1 hypothetical protein [Candidatus Competibacteraceae bacterium]
MANKEPLAYEDRRSLAEKIADTENRILERRRLLVARRTFVAQRVREQVTSPAILLLAGGVGFIVGELTRSKQQASSDQKATPMASPLLQVVGNIVELVRPIFLAEVGKIMQAFSSGASIQVADQLARLFNKPADHSENA